MWKCKFMRERDFKSGDQPLLGPSFFMCCLTSIWTYLPHNHKLHMYLTYCLTWYESTIDRSFSIAFYSRTLLYMGIIRKCVCDIFSTIGLHPVSKSYIMQYEITIHLVYYISYTFHVGKAIKKYQCTPFFKSLLHSNKHFFVCQNMYTRLLIQIWPIIKCSFAVCFWKAIRKKFLLKCF